MPACHACMPSMSPSGQRAQEVSERERYYPEQVQRCPCHLNAVNRGRPAYEDDWLQTVVGANELPDSPWVDSFRSGQSR
jgi:hypothetical protein